MPEGPELELENMEQVDKEMMLFALRSTLENAEDGTLTKGEYHYKLVTYGFEQQYGCLTDVTLTPDLIEMAVERLTTCFKAVEEESMTEDDYFFELISPSFFYTSGKYNQSDQLLMTMSALSEISRFQDEENDTNVLNAFLMLNEPSDLEDEENIFIALPVLNGPYDLETPLIKEKSTSKDPIYQKTRIHDEKSTSKDPIYQKTRIRDTPLIKEKSTSKDPIYQKTRIHDTPLIKEKSTSKDPIYQKTRIRDRKIDFTLKQMIQVDQNQLHRVFGKRSVGGNTIYISMVCMLLHIRIFLTKVLKKLLVGGNSTNISIIRWLSVLLLLDHVDKCAVALPVNTEHSPVTLTAGSNGIVPFAYEKADPFAAKYYNLQLEGKDRPFFMAGVIVPEGLTSTDQVERFDVKFVENDQEMSIEIYIAHVSVEDQGIYIATLVVQGDTTESHVIKRAVMIVIPPGPALCFLRPSDIFYETQEMHCHSKRGSGNSTLTCFQEEEKIPYQLNSGQSDTQIVYRRQFWIRNLNFPIYCCSHDIKEIETIQQKSCNQFRFPPEPEPEPEISTTLKPYKSTNIARITKSIFMEDNNNPSSEIISISGSDRNIDKSSLIISLIFSIIYLII